MPDEPGNEAPRSPPTYCERCGGSLVALATRDSGQPCEQDQCGKTVYLTEAGEAREGLRDPPGTTKVSLDPATNANLSRAGVAWLVAALVSAGEPENLTDLEAALRRYGDESEQILKTSALLQDLDPETETGSEVVVERLSKHLWTREWHALLLKSAAQMGWDALRNGDARAAFLAGYRAANAHAMLVLREPAFEETIWRGYEANQLRRTPERQRP